MTVKLTTRPSRGQSYTEWLETWDDVLANAKSFKAGVTSGRAQDGIYDFGLMATQFPEWVKMIRSYMDDITYVIYAWDTPMAVWVERGEGFWISPDVNYISPATGRKSTRTPGIQSRINYAIGREGHRIVSKLDK